MDGEVFNTMNFPIHRWDFYDDWPEEVDVPRCIACGAPYFACTDIIFTQANEGEITNG